MALLFLKYTKITHAYTHRNTRRNTHRVPELEWKIQKPLSWPSTCHPLTLSSKHTTLFFLKVSCSKLWQGEIKFTLKPHPALLSLLPRDSVFQHRPGGWVYVWVRATPRSCAPGTAPIPAWQWTHTPVHTWGPRLWTATSLPAFVSSINCDTRLTQGERAGGFKKKRCQDYPCLKIMSGM